MDSNLGGRVLPFQPGMYQYDYDLYRGQRRRPWFVIRIGQNSPELNKETFPKFVEKIRLHFLDRRILLDSEFLECRPDFDDSYRSLEEIHNLLDDILEQRDAKYEAGILSIPICFLICDFQESQATDAVVEYYAKKVNVCPFDAKDIVKAIYKREYNDIEEHCDEFIKEIVKGENIKESYAEKRELKGLSEFGLESLQYEFHLPSSSSREQSRHRHSSQRDYPPRESYHAQRDFSSQAHPQRGYASTGNNKIPRGFSSPPRQRGFSPQRDSRPQHQGQRGCSSPPRQRGLSPQRDSRHQYQASRGCSSPPPQRGLSSPRDSPKPRHQLQRGFSPPPKQRGFSPPPKQRGLSPTPKVRDAVPPGLPPPGLSPPKRLTPHTPPPGLDVRAPPGLRIRNEIDDFDDSDSDEERRINSNQAPSQHLKQLCTIDDINVALKSVTEDSLIGELMKTKNLMANDIARAKLFNRFAELFDTAKDNADFLLVVNFSCSSENPDARRSIEQIMFNCFKQRYPEEVVIRFIEPCVNRIRRWDLDSAELVFEITFLFGYLCRLRPTINQDIIQCWRAFWNAFNRISPVEIFRVCQHVMREDYEAQENLCLRINRFIDRERLESERNREEERRRNREAEDERRRREDAMRQREEEEKYERRRREDEMRQREEEQKYERRRREDDARRRDEEEKRYREQENRYKDERRYERDDMYRDNTGRSRLNGTRSYDEEEEEEEGYDEIDQAQSSNTQQPLRDSPPIEEKELIPETQPYKFAENNRDFDDEQDELSIPLWKKCETIDPPNDFRELSLLPTLKDYFKPEEPYVRRICDDGVYANLQHYLDVQYRLMREDLISPLRDGVDIYKKNGTYKNNRIPNVISSDLTIYRVDRIEGKQASPRDGFEMRYCFLNGQTMMQLRTDPKGPRGGGLVLLSSDRFENEMHLAYLNDFKEERNSVSIIMLDEMKDRPIELNKPYLMAEATSYLPSYKFVLQTMQKISKFAPIPFQRYLLYRKHDIFRPAYQRQEKTENQLKYEKRMEDHFNEIRSETVAKRMQAGKTTEKKKKKNTKKSKKQKKANNWDENFSDDDFKETSEESESCDSDDELYWLKKPIFKKPIGILSQEDGNKMQIDGKWYNITKLLSEFFPKNMDDSQRVAFCNSFQREFSIIQGPPGTGKTHIGVEIVKAMLKNRQHWRMTEPILIVCYTNSAIDQFLERIYMMISDDEELSKENGKPKIIRFGSKSESDILSRHRLLREHVMSDYRMGPATDQNLVNEANSAYKDRNKREDELACSSFGLYASRKDLLSFTVLCRVMLPEFQRELREWAVTHTDTKDVPLSHDEALACWLLDTEFGKSKISAKAATKYSKLEVEETSHEDDEYSDVEDGEGLTSEEFLDRMFRKINIKCTASELNDARFDEGENDGFHSESPWDVAMKRARGVVLLEIPMKIIGNNQSYGTDVEIVERIREEKAMILKTAAMPKEEVEDVRFIFSLPRPKRWALYQHWCKVFRKLMCDVIPKHIESYKVACLKAKKNQEKVDASTCKSSMIIGCTTSGCSRLRTMLERVKPRILIVEEAAEVLESHILSAMISTIEHTVMIGDHQQLRPNPAVHELGTEYGMQVSMFERLVERGLPYSQLKEQHRMNTNIADLIVRPSFYPTVYDSDNVKYYPPVEGLAENLYFWSHCGKEQTHDGASWYNLGEVDMCIGLIRHLLKQNYTPNDITVITTYAAQRQEMLRAFQRFLGGSVEEPLVPVETVDSYQGQENKIVIVSLVRSHRGLPENTGIGFLAVKNRICVALTRAKYGMYIVGNGAYLKNNSILWSKIVESLDSKKLIEYHIDVKCTAHGNIEKISYPVDFEKLSPDGGCSQICDIQKLCGHKCRKSCHPNVESIHIQPCYYECQKFCNKNHACKKKCYEECGNCMEYVELKLECGHTISTPCFMSEKAICDQRCSKLIECGHKCLNVCGYECSKEENCKEMIEKLLKCGHVRKIECASYVEGQEPECVEQCTRTMLGCKHQCREICGKQCPLQCIQPVVKELSTCGHPITVPCHQVGQNDEIDEDLFVCQTLVKKKLEPCHHEVNVRCGEEAITDYCTVVCREKVEKCGHECGDTCSKCFTSGVHHCQVRCGKSLGCGHVCTAKCGDDCPPCQSFCETSCTHMNCGMSNKGYGRECQKLCVMCTNNCQNKCIHRSCDRKCFEACQVPICHEKCTLALRCGHGCLGMCGEICPNVCGTCNRKGYEEVTNVMGKENVKVYRLIQLQHCAHVFPVEYLDEYVKKKKDTNSTLICPRNGCSRQFGDVWRYAKYSKNLILEQNKKKFQKSLNPSEQLIRLQQTLKILDGCTVFAQDINAHMKGTSKAVRAQCSNFLFWLSHDFRTAIGNISKNLESTEFYRQISICVHGLGYLFSSVLYVRINKNKKEYPPVTEQFLMDLFSDCDMFNRQINSIEEVHAEMRKLMQFELLGAIIPKVRFLLSRINCVLQLMVLCRYLKTIKQDMSATFVNSLKSACLDFFKQNERMDLTARIENIEKIMIAEYPEIEKMDGFQKWNKFAIPEF